MMEIRIQNQRMMMKLQKEYFLEHIFGRETLFFVQHTTRYIFCMYVGYRYQNIFLPTVFAIFFPSFQQYGTVI